MATSTNSSAYEWMYEYYYDYMDPVPVDASKLKFNRYSIVIIFWITLVAFIGILFFILSSISGTKDLPRPQTIRRRASRERRSTSKILV